MFSQYISICYNFKCFEFSVDVGKLIIDNYSLTVLKST